MAVTSIWPIKNNLKSVIDYVQNPEKITEEYYTENAALHIIDGVVEYAADEVKTERRQYVSCINCAELTAAKEFAYTHRLWKKQSGRPCYHGYQSFKPGEVNAQMAHAIGVELAQRLWGDRFQVVVATHCNTGVYHNHFIVNSVSFRDGVKFFNSHENYRQMRAVSDELCREYGISVIDRPQRRGKNYGQYTAERNGKLTHSQMIRSDIDRAVAASQTARDFFLQLREMGYTVTTHGTSGAPLKHPKLTPPGSTKNYRFDTLGEEYALERILERVREGSFYRPIEPQRRSRHMKTARMPAKKLTGLRALYFRYCYELGVIVKHPERTGRVSYLLREDALKLERYIAETKLLIANRIEDIDDLEEYKAALNQKIDRLSAERNELRNRLRRAVRAQDESGAAAIRTEIQRVSVDMRNARKEVDYCADIAERSAQVQANLTELTNDKKNQEVNRHEYTSRSGGSGREDHAGWR